MRTLSPFFALSLFGCGLTPLTDFLPEESSDEIVSLGGLEASSSSIDFGIVQANSTEYYDLVLTNRSDDILVIAETLMEGDSAFVIDTLTTLPVELEPEFSEIVTLAFTPADSLDYSGNLWIQLDGLDDTLSIELMGSGSTEAGNFDDASSISLSSNSIDFGEVNTFSEHLELVTITNDGDDDVLVRNITASDAYYSYTGDIVPPTVMSSGSSKSFYVAFYPQSEGEFPATITVETDINDGTDFDIAVSGSAVEPDCEVCTPDIRISTPSGDSHLMNFLSVYNFPDEQLVSIQNLSDVELTISDAYITNDSQGGDFALSFSPVTLGPWETTAAAISFTCPELCFEYPNPISDTNILHFISDDPSESDYQIELWTGF